MQKAIQSFFQILFKGIIIGIIVAIILMSLEHVFGRKIKWNLNLIQEIGYYVFYGVVLTLVNRTFFDYLNHKVEWTPKWERFRILIGAVGSIILTMLGIFFIRFTINTVFENQAVEVFLKNEQFRFYVVALIVTMIISLVFHTIYYYKKAQENKVKEQKLIAGNVSAQFESLKNQIDPHFLFNSLNVLSSLIEENPENAQKFTTSLSKIYRYVLEQKDKELVSLEEELNFAKTYMQLLAMRFENSLTYSLPELSPSEEGKVVPLSLQLLLENTIKHNIVSDTQPLHISITIENGYLVVSNNFQKKEVLQNRKGVGLQNIVNRYAILTEKNVSVEQDDTYFKVKLPLLTKPLLIMKNNNYNEVDAYMRAQKRVKEIKDFYGNLLSYLFVIPILIFINYKTYWEFQWFWFPMIGWGIGLSFHAFGVFGYGRTWEERKIREILEKENQLNNNTKWE
jgi:two-component system, LytTR family, sensor kinase